MWGSARSFLFAAVAMAAVMAIANASAIGGAVAQDLPIAPVPLVPLDPAPAITLPTTAGTLAIGAEQPPNEGYWLVGHDTRSPLSAALWSADPTALLANSPRDVHYVFMSYADTPEGVAEDMAGIGSRMSAAVAALTSEADREHWRSHLHYVTQNPLDLEGPLPALLWSWGPVVANLHATWRDASGDEQALDADGTTDSGWARSLTDTGPISAALADYGGLACGQTAPTSDVLGKVALIMRGTCNFTEKVANAEKHGAVAALIYTTPDREKGSMGGTCDPCPKIPVAMVDNDVGVELLGALGAGSAVTATLAPLTLGAEATGVDHQGRLREIGYIPFPFNAYLEKPLDNFYLLAKE